MRPKTTVPLCGGCPREGTFEIETGTSVRDLQERIVRHCSPTLAGMKCGSMFRVASRLHGVSPCIGEIMGDIGHKGVAIDVLDHDDGGTLVFVYRPGLLMGRLSDPEVGDFLRGYGYTMGDLGSTLDELRGRIGRCRTIPPEIGVFLGYPMDDIRGYILNEGRCCRCIGCWKVYGDVEEAERTFSMFRECRDIYSRRLSEGVPMAELVVGRGQNQLSRERCLRLFDSALREAPILLSTELTLSAENPWSVMSSRTPSVSTGPAFTL